MTSYETSIIVLELMTLMVMILGIIIQLLLSVMDKKKEK